MHAFHCMYATRELLSADEKKVDVTIMLRTLGLSVRGRWEMMDSGGTFFSIFGGLNFASAVSGGLKCLTMKRGTVSVVANSQSPQQSYPIKPAQNLAIQLSSASHEPILID